MEHIPDELGCQRIAIYQEACQLVFDDERDRFIHRTADSDYPLVGLDLHKVGIVGDFTCGRLVVPLHPFRRIAEFRVHVERLYESLFPESAIGFDSPKNVS